MIALVEPHRTPMHDGDMPYVPTNTLCMYYACMPHIQVRDVPIEVHEALVRQAERSGQSLQQYLSSRLAQIASTPTADEVLDWIEERDKGDLSAADAIAAIESERARS